ncbi:LamG-like jellyroll fold domain-containing protein [Nanoarchaeota archaeon]
MINSTNYTITVHTKDASNNVNDTDVNNTASTRYVDMITPGLIINSPSGTLADHTPTLNVTVDETSTIWYNVDGGANTTICTSCSGNQITYPVLEEGSYTINVYANDTAGNLNNSETTSLTVDMNLNYYDSFDDSSSISESNGINLNSGNISFGNLDVALICGAATCADVDEDIPMKNHLTNTLRHNVDTFAGNDQSWTPTDYDVIVIAESVTSGNTGWLKSEAVGILTVEGSNNDEFDFGTGGNSNDAPDTIINITNNTHYITQPFSLGPVSVASTSGNGGYITGWSNDVNLLAYYNNTPTQSKLLAVESGGTLADSSTAAERRVFFGARYFANLNSNGTTIFNRALDWVAGNTGSSTSGNFTIHAINTTQNITRIDNITWTESGTDIANNITVQLSVDNGLNWYNATNAGAITGFGYNNSLVYRVLFNTNSSTKIYLLDMNITWRETDNAPTVNLGQPAENKINYTSKYVNLTFTATITEDYGLINCSFWHNITGTWKQNQTQTVSGTSDSVIFNLTQLIDYSFVWNIGCYDDVSQIGWGSDNRSVILNWTNSPPTQTAPILNSTYGTNYTYENLTCYNQSTADFDGDSVKNIYNWKKNGTSITVLNMPFEGGSNSTYTKDYSGYGNDASAMGRTWVSNGGYDGKGVYYLDQTDIGLEILDSPSLDLEDFTVSLWVWYNDSNTQWERILVKKNNWNDPNGWQIALNDENNNLEIVGSGSTTFNPVCVSDWETTDNQRWVHIAVIFNGSNAIAYCDGAYKDIGTIEPITANTENLTIGNIHSMADRDWVGYIDDIMIFNGTLSAEQIKAIYENKTNTILSQETSVGDIWRCDITPNDGIEDGTTLSNNLTIILDTAKPDSITNLNNQNKSFTWIYWNWTNPTNNDFSEAIIYIDGIWKANTSNNFYNATGLFGDTNYTITVHTKDTTGNINNTDVNSSTKTLDNVPPNSITNLNNQTQGQTSIFWNWTNPTNYDFDQAIIYINGVWKANTSNNYYTANGLLSNTSHTITVHTKDILGNLNDTEVNSTTVTLPGNLPLHSTPLLNSTFQTNSTLENLTCYNQSTIDPNWDPIKNIFNWYRNGTSIAVLNMPFEGGSNSTWTRDYSPYANNATVNGTTWNSTGGYDGFGAYQFDGTGNKRIEVGSLGTFNKVTIAFWAKRANTGTWDAVMNNDGWSGQYLHLQFPSNNNLRLAINGNNPGDVDSSFTITDSNWHYIATVYDSDADSVSFYLDGQLNSNVSYTTANPVILGPGRIGDWDGGGREFNGTIDDLIIYNHTLTSQQIKAIYENKTNVIVLNETTLGETWKCCSILIPIEDVLNWVPFYVKC